MGVQSYWTPSVSTLRFSAIDLMHAERITAHVIASQAANRHGTGILDWSGPLAPDGVRGPLQQRGQFPMSFNTGRGSARRRPPAHRSAPPPGIVRPPAAALVRHPPRERLGSPPLPFRGAFPAKIGSEFALRQHPFLEMTDVDRRKTAICPITSIFMLSKFACPDEMIGFWLTIPFDDN